VIAASSALRAVDGVCNAYLVQQSWE